MLCAVHFSFFFFFNDTATTEIYTLSLHDALPISVCDSQVGKCRLRAESSSAARSCAADRQGIQHMNPSRTRIQVASRSEEHTSELQSRLHLVCRLLLEKKKKKTHT